MPSTRKCSGAEPGIDYTAIYDAPHGFREFGVQAGRPRHRYGQPLLTDRLIVSP